MRVADISAALGDLLNESEEHEQALKPQRRCYLQCSKG
jgi:hypothetical protein